MSAFIHADDYYLYRLSIIAVMKQRQN